MDLKELCREIIADESEAGREKYLGKVYAELEKTKGYRRRTLGRTMYGPVRLFEEAERKEGARDVLLLGGLHPFCEAATSVSVIHAMREKHDYNLSAIPVLSPWAFVAPVTNRRSLRQYDGDEASKVKQYRNTNYHDNVDLEESWDITLGGSAMDMERLTKLTKNFDLCFDVVVECHMDYDRGGVFPGTYVPTHKVGIVLYVTEPRDFSDIMGEAMLLHGRMDTAAEIGKGRNSFLLGVNGMTAVLETDPDDITLLKRFVDVLVRHF